MSEQKEITNEDLINYWKMLIGKLHEGISQLSGEAQDIMLQKHPEADVEGVLLAIARMTGRDPETLGVDEILKCHLTIENQFANGKASIIREGNVITWKSNLSYCYDPKIGQKMINPYPAYCKNCDHFWKLLYGFAHKGPVKVTGLKSVLRGDDECITQIELL